jgi:LysM repeat protein
MRRDPASVSQENDYGFWDDDRGHSSRLGRRFHHSTDLDDHSWSPKPRRHEPHPKNPLWPRLGALLALGVLALPIALMMRGSHSTTSLRGADSPSEPQNTSNVVLPLDAVPGDATTNAPQVVEASSSSDAASSTDADQRAVVDPIGSRVPVNVEAVPQLQADAKVESIEPSTTVAATTAARPASAPPKTRNCTNPYEPTLGDYWILIADKANVTLADLLNVNDATTDTPIYPGWDICLPAGASASSTAAASSSDVSSSAAKSSTTAKATSTTAKPPATTAKPATATPTTVASTTAPPTTLPRRTYSRTEVEQIIRDVWPDDLENEALRIATRESNLIPTAKNWCCYGLFQIHWAANQKSLASWGITSANMLLDPRTNAYAAYAMYLRAGGWGPWQ